MDTKKVGDISEQAFILAALQHGYAVSRPIGDRLPYDCIIDVAGKLVKVQVKTAYISSHKATAGLLFSAGARNSISNQKAIVYRWYAIGDFDVAAIFDPSDHGFFLIPGDLFISTRKTNMQYTYKQQRAGTPNWGVYKNKWCIFTQSYM